MVEEVAPLEGEYKLVTILFADVVGSTDLSQRIDAEAVRVILDRCLQRISAAVEEYGGVVARLMGDGLLAFFGAPKAHEDDAERAAMAALQIHTSIESYAQELDQDLKVRVGINTGRVVMGDVGGESLSEYTAMGEPVHLATRLESAADSGSTFLGETTARLIRHRFELNEVEPLKVKGFEDPVPAFELVQERLVPERAKGIAGLHSALVGRDAERSQLDERVEALELGRGAIVSILGDPGIGKSRLLADTKERFADHPLRWAEGRAYSYTEDQPFSVILDFLGELLDLAPDDTPAVIDLKLETTLSRWFDENLGEVWPYLANLLGAPIPPQYEETLQQLDSKAMNAKITQAVQLLVEAIANENSLVLAFDDLHWADYSSLSVIQTLLMSSESVPILLVLIFRPERDKPCWELKQRAETDFAHRYLELPLKPLDEISSQALIENLLKVASFPETLLALIRDRSEGNPFFVEELIRELIEGGVLVRKDGNWEATQEMADLEVPDSLEKVIQARLDRLPEAERSTLQAASVIGRRFAYRVLEAIAEQNGDLSKRLLRLQQADMVRERARLPELEYIFKHVIVQEVTYRTLLKEQRRPLHRQVAKVIEELFPERREELYGALANHYAAADDRELALVYFQRAATRAREVYAYEEAIGYLRRALDLISDDDLENRKELLEAMGDVHHYLGKRSKAIPYFQSALETDPGEEKWERVRLHRKIGQSAAGMRTPVQHAQYDGVGLENLEAGLQLTKTDPAHPETVKLLNTLAFRYANYTIIALPDFEVAESYAREAVRMAQELGSPLEVTAALSTLGLIYSAKGDLRKAVELAQERLDLSRQPDFTDLRAKAHILFQAGDTQKDIGQYETAKAYLEEALELAEQIQDIALQASALGVIGECLFRLDCWDQVLEIETRWREIQKTYAFERTGFLCFYIGLSASVHALRGDSGDAKTLREEAYGIMIQSTGDTAEEDVWIRNQHF